MTIHEFITHSTNLLSSVAIDSPRLSTELILANTLGLERKELIKQLLLNPKALLSAEQEQAALALVQRRKAGEPVAYLISEKEFYGRNFAVNSATLIPRPETELIVDLALENFKNKENGSFADLGTGTGCIAISLALELKDWQGIGIELSPEAVLLAKQNALNMNTPESLSFIEADFTRYEFTPTSLDLLVSNPPYISEDEYQNLNHEVRDFEPKRALVPKLCEEGRAASGLEHLEIIIKIASMALKPSGLILMEIGWQQGAKVLSLFSEKIWQEKVCYKDLAGLDRVVMGRLA